MTYRAELSDHVLEQLHDLPLGVRFALAEALAEVVAAPDDSAISDPTGTPGVRTAVFGEAGLVDYLIMEDLRVVLALNLLWGG